MKIRRNNKYWKCLKKLKDQLENQNSTNYMHARLKIKMKNLVVMLLLCFKHNKIKYKF